MTTTDLPHNCWQLSLVKCLQPCLQVGGSAGLAQAIELQDMAALEGNLHRHLPMLVSILELHERHENNFHVWTSPTSRRGVGCCVCVASSGTACCACPSCAVSRATLASARLLGTTETAAFAGRSCGTAPGASQSAQAACSQSDLKRLTTASLACSHRPTSEHRTVHGVPFVGCIAIAILQTMSQHDDR
jgi:hypothetical protein